MGKHKPIWDPSTDCGDYVVAAGCHDLRTTGKKRFQKQYYTHNTRPGSLKQMSMDKMFAKWGGGEVLKKAVRGMLPKNRLRDKRLARLKGNGVTAFHCQSNADKFWIQFSKDWHTHIRTIWSNSVEGHILRDNYLRPPSQ
jgi:large subunit ribosomal protein L13